MKTLYRAGAAVVAVAASFVLLAQPALAQVPSDGDVSPDAPVGSYLTINNTLVLIITGTLIPIVNGFLLRPENPAWVKVLVANMLGTAAHAFSQVIQEDGTAFLSQEWFVGLALTLVTMVATYGHLWKPVMNPNANVPTVAPVGDLLS